MTRMTTGEARQSFSDTVNRVAYRGERVVLQRRGKDIAAIVPLADLRAMEEREARPAAGVAESATSAMAAKRGPARKKTTKETQQEAGKKGARTPIKGRATAASARDNRKTKINSSLSIQPARLAAICRRYGVRILSLFGSATRSDFRPDSDVDLLVEFEQDSTPGLFRMAELQAELERLFGRSVDLVTPDILRNPYRRASIIPSLQRLYGV